MKDQIKQWYAEINGQEAADAVDDRAYAAAARYMEINEYDRFLAGVKRIDWQGDVEEIISKTALTALDVLRLAIGGEFDQLAAQ